MNTQLSKRIALCLLSGIGVGLTQDTDTIIEFLGEGVFFYGLSGLVFAAGVLFPYLKRDDRVLLRALALVIASGVSYYCAVWIALESPFSGPDGWIPFTLASIAGATIVFAALVLVTPIHVSRQYVLYGLTAGLAGGPVTYVTLPESTVLILIGHASWHTLICLAIYFGTRKESRTEFIE